MASELLEIGELLDRKPAQLSGGQKQRVAIGRAIVREPKVFLFDEPISHLDAKLRAHMRGEIKRLQKELGTSMIYVTHDQIEALTMADKVAVMNLGVLQQVGTPEQIYHEPANEWVATFVGEPAMNIYPVEIVEKDGGIFAVNADLSVQLAEAHRVACERERKRPTNAGPSSVLGHLTSTLAKPAIPTRLKPGSMSPNRLARKPLLTCG